MRRSWVRGALAGAMALLIAGCGSNAPASSASQAATSATASASSAASASTAASASAAASSAAASQAAVDPMDDISIAAPYSLDALDDASATTFENQMKTSLGALGSLIHVGARTAKKTGLPAGVVIAMAFPGIPGTDSPAFLDSVATGAAGSAQGTTKSQTIDGHDVKVIEGPQGSFALYKHGADTVIMAVGANTDQAVAIITAIISASE